MINGIDGEGEERIKEGGGSGWWMGSDVAFLPLCVAGLYNIITPMSLS